MSQFEDGGALNKDHGCTVILAVADFLWLEAQKKRFLTHTEKGNPLD